MARPSQVGHNLASLGHGLNDENTAICEKNS